MENTNMHENIHTNNKEITPLLSGLGENCENLMLRKVIQNSFSTFTKILRQLNEKRLPYYLCGGTGSLEELYTMGLSKTIIGGPYAVCTKCRAMTSDHIMELVDHKRVTCDKCGSRLTLDGDPKDSVYFWHPVNSDVHFEVCVNDEGFKLAHDYIESLIQSLQLSSDELVVTESPTERVLVYRLVTVKCDGTVPNKHYRGPQFTVTRYELNKFIEANLSSKKPFIAPDYAGLIELKRNHAKALRPRYFNLFPIIALQRGTFAAGADGETPYKFFEQLEKLPVFCRFPLTPEGIFNIAYLGDPAYYGGAQKQNEAMEFYEWFMSSSRPVSTRKIGSQLKKAGTSIVDKSVINWMSRIISMKSYYENVDFVAMHYLLSL